MGYKAVEAVLAHSRAKGPPHHLLLIIAHRLNDDIGEWPMSIADLQRDVRMGRRQVFAALAELRALNELTTKRTGKKSLYSTPLYVPTNSAETRTSEQDSEVRKSAHQSENRSAEIRTSEVRKSAPQKCGNPHLSTYSHTITYSPYMAASPRERETKTRRPDPLWDAAIAAGLPAPVTKSERGKWNAALKMIRDVNATPDDLTARIREYKRIWPDITCTLMGVVNNWTPLGANGNATHTTHRTEDSAASREEAAAAHRKQMEASREFQRALAAEMEARGIRLETSK